MEHRWNEIIRVKMKCSGKNLSQGQFVHHKSHMDAESNPDLHGERPTTDRLSHGMARTTACCYPAALFTPFHFTLGCLSSALCTYVNGQWNRDVSRNSPSTLPSLKISRVPCLETSEFDDPLTRCHVPEGRILLLHLCENIKTFLRFRIHDNSVRMVTRLKQKGRRVEFHYFYKYEIFLFPT
jgi:hypothetical protein